MAKRSRPKARQPITRERALDEAVRLADAGGLHELSMRKLAQRLGIEAMSLYHHVPNKDAILDGMVDRVFAELELPKPDGDWKRAMRARAHALLGALRRHPWAVSLLESRRTPGPATLAHHDAVLGALRAGGLSLELTAHAYALLDSFIYGFAQQEQVLPFEAGDEVETQALAKEFFAQLPPGAFPHLAELTLGHVLEPGYTYAKEFEFGLELILEGLERKRT
ncbi:MAG: TetR/AcrR family transcriptional regulator C-terminal domain-containing protein [Myxococcaceae bacterium]|nr:TetR/AcrR family transcriptional regulator C-terminal domain-containing protein [Myxococcaceae bacterium]